mmetsp:Transcript_9839/g.9941  ORF Transcript_9839/g.9941 Transcript_9839/m.9941 type:complete len:109 (+) Transcript_9839:20-346(+)
MGGSEHATNAMGAVIIAGGLYAYLKKGSIASLIGSSVIGAGFIGAGVLISNGYNLEGHGLSSASSLMLTGIALQRLITTRKPMPGLPLLFLGGASAAYQIKKTLEWYA